MLVRAASRRPQSCLDNEIQEKPVHLTGFFGMKRTSNILQVYFGVSYAMGIFSLV